MPDAGAAIVDVLAAAGVRRCYTVPGESFLEVLSAVDRHPDMALVSTRHESGASFAACAEAKLTGVPALVAATRAVGATNLAIGVHAAQQDSVPMVVLLGQVETPHLGKEAFQEVDLAALYRPLTKWAVTASRGDRLTELVARGVRLATTGRPGPVMIAVPSDLLAEQVEAPDTGHLLGRGPTARPAPTSDGATALAERLHRARQPVFIVGGGARDARAELIEAAEAFDAGVYAAFRRQDAFPNDHPRYCGHLGLAPPPQTLTALGDADLVVVVGCRLDEITTQGYTLPGPDTEVVQIDLDPDSAAGSIAVTQTVVADAATALADLVALARPSEERHWADAHAAWQASTVVGESRASVGLDPAEVVAAMAEVLPDDTVVCNDAGNFAGFVHRHWVFRHPRTQLGPKSGAMGYAVPAALGAKLASPERTVVATAGDGGFLMTGQELETAVRMSAPVVVMVFRNGLYGTIAMHQAREQGHLAGITVGDVDVAAYARSLGAVGLTVSDPADLRPALSEALAAGRPAVVDVVTDPALINPTGRLSELHPA